MEELIEKEVIFSKCLALIEKTIENISQIDEGLFPTKVSEEARDLLLNALIKIKDKNMLRPMDPPVLYNRLISLQSLVEQVENSTINYISWPFVSYCNDIWESFYGLDGPKIFYTATHEHNFIISPFTTELSSALSVIMPSSIITEIVDKRELYCLHLSSLEGTNLPLYANVAHEFGHPLYYLNRSEFFEFWERRLKDVHDSILKDLKSLEKAQSSRIMIRVKAITLSIAKELLADLFAGLVMGPAFFLSLYEMSWGGNSSAWTIALSPISYDIEAYPSYNFRFRCIMEFINIMEIENKAKEEFKRIKKEKLKQIASIFSRIKLSDEDEVFIVRPDSDNDKLIILKTLNIKIGDLKNSLKGFLDDSYNFLINKYKKEFSTPNMHDVAELLIRLENNILPNIIPDGTLLGVPAEFYAILNASALYRLHILLDKNTPEDIGKIKDEIDKIERLAAKAFEVSYVQRKFSMRNR